MEIHIGIDSPNRRQAVELARRLITVSLSDDDQRKSAEFTEVVNRIGDDLELRALVLLALAEIAAALVGVNALDRGLEANEVWDDLERIFEQEQDKADFSGLVRRLKEQDLQPPAPAADTP